MGARRTTTLDKDLVTVYFLHGSRPERKVAVRRVWLVLGGVAVVFGFLFLRVWQEMHVVSVGYQVSRLEQEQRELVEAQRILRSRRDALASLERVEAVALGELGMQVPERRQVVFLVDPTAQVSPLKRWLSNQGMLGRGAAALRGMWQAFVGDKEGTIGGQEP